jgi:putative flippase GtrA
MSSPRGLASKAALREAIRYGLVGVLNTLVGFAAFSFCLYVLRLDPGLSDVLSYIVGLANSFFWNRRWTFNSRGRATRQLLPFIVVFAVSFLVQYLVFNLAKGVLGAGPVLAYVCGMIVYTGLGYLGNKRFTFKDGGKDRAGKEEECEG